jgi:hypothetical protein
MLLSAVSCITKLKQRASTENSPCTEEMKMPSSCKSLKAQSRKLSYVLRTMENKSACFFRPLSFAVRRESQYCLFLQHSSKGPYILFYYTDIFTHNASQSEANNHKKFQTCLFVILLHHQCLKLYSISNEYGALVE